MTVRRGRAVGCVIILAVVLSAPMACVAPLKNRHLCAEFKQVRCLTKPECVYDIERGCELCRCAQPVYEPLDRPAAAPPAAPRF